MTPIDTYAIYCSKKGRKGEGKAGEEQEEGVGRRGRDQKEGEGRDVNLFIHSPTSRSPAPDAATSII